MPISYFDEQPLGRTITRLTADIDGIESFFSNTLPRVLTAFLTVFSVLLAMLLTDLKIGSIICLSSLPALIFTIICRKPVRHWLRHYKMKSAATNAQLAELINGLPLIKMFGLEAWSYETFRKSSEEMLSSANHLVNWNTFIRPLAAFLCGIPIVFILWWGGHLTLDGQLSIGLLVAFIRYAERYFRPIMQLSFELHLVQDAIASTERVNKMLEEPVEVDEQSSKNGIKKSIKGAIVFENVHMAYQDCKPVLKGLNFKLDAGSKIGFVGRTGSGKSSAIHLIPRLYHAQSGQITIDGIALDLWDKQCLRQQIGLVSQEIIIFQGTLRANLIATLDPTPSDDKLLDASRKTGLSLVIERLENGLDTLLFDSGSNLSMGERQLVALTRILLRNPSILILDEATAYLDRECEILIQNAIHELQAGRTCIIIAHRLKTIENCDEIFVFEDGQIIEHGNHIDLLHSNGTYANLVKGQLGNAHN